MENGDVSKRILVLAIALLITVVPVATARASDTPGIASTLTLLQSPMATPPPSATQPPNSGRVTAYGLNVRSGPGIAYPIVGGLRLGDSVEVVGKNATGTWLQIVYLADSDGRGWVAAAYVDLTGSLAEVPEVSAPPPPRRLWKAALRLRPS